jgi:hypothetical protein
VLIDAITAGRAAAILRGGAPPEVSDFDLAWLERGVEVRKPLGYAAEVAFEEAAPVRDFPLYRGQRHFRACTGRRRRGGMSGSSRGWSVIT